jgi:predicted heme/steroid binding protein
MAVPKWAINLGIVCGIIGALAGMFWPDVEEVCPWFVEGMENPHLAKEATPTDFSWTDQASEADKSVDISFDRSGERVFTREELAKHDGSDPDFPVYLSINHEVFDVSGEEGSRFYGVGEHYHVFAGKDSTRAFCLASLKDGDVGSDDISDFTTTQMDEYRTRTLFYRNKYGPRVGVLEGGVKTTKSGLFG